LAFVKRKLEDADIDLEYTREQVASVERLGGRATDLENVGIRVLYLSLKLTLHFYYS
jgi:hypothetical protein